MGKALMSGMLWCHAPTVMATHLDGRPARCFQPNYYYFIIPHTHCALVAETLIFKKNITMLSILPICLFACRRPFSPLSLPLLFSSAPHQCPHPLPPPPEFFILQFFFLFSFSFVFLSFVSLRPFPSLSISCSRMKGSQSTTGP